MKTTMTTRSTANPRRTTLGHLTDTGETFAPADPRRATAGDDALPQRTANPRRTTLMVVPKH